MCKPNPLQISMKLFHFFGGDFFYWEDNPDLKMKIKFCFASICIFLGTDRKSQLLLLWQFATYMIQEKIK